MRRFFALLGGLALAATAATHAQTPQPVTVDNFVRAESDLYMGGLLKDSGGRLGTFNHRREVANIDHQTVIRLNRDTIYSSALFDLDAAPATITLPDAGSRFMSMQVISEDHYVPAVVLQGRCAHPDPGDGRHALCRGRDPDAGRSQRSGGRREGARAAGRDHREPGEGGARSRFRTGIRSSQKKVRDALLVLASTSTGFGGAFGKQGEVDPVKRLLGAAAGWGGNPDKDATYLSETPAKNDGTTVHRVTVKDVPVDAFWSISVYNEQGYYEKNPLDAYTINSITGKKAADGSTTVQFGGCDGKIPNCIPIVKGWNYTVRLYRPRAEILDGSWKFPVAQAVP